MEDKKVPLKTIDFIKQEHEPSTSREIETKVFIKEEMFEVVIKVEPDIDIKMEPDGDLKIEPDVVIKVEPIDDIDIKMKPDAPNIKLDPGEIEVKIEEQKCNKKKKKIKKKESQFTCRICDKEFSTRSNRTRHMVNHTPKSPSVSTEQDYPLSREYITKNIIQVTITDAERQIEHELSLAKRRHFRFKCDTCACGFVARKAYDKHMVLHSEVSGDYQCSICFIHLRSPILHYQHRLRHFRRYKCALCNVVGPLKEKEAVASHIRQEHAHTGFQCQQCDKIFKRAKYLKLHVAQIHNKSKEFPCPICHKVYYQTTNLRIHLRRHDSDVKQNGGDTFVCNVCHAKFTLKCSLRRHVKTAHTTQEALACDTCHKWYKDRLALKRHKDREHSNVIIEKELCTICNKWFATPALLRWHSRRMHMEEGKRFECDHCKKRFMRKSEIRDHIDTVHLAIKDKVCDQCGKGFTTNFLLHRHKRVHSGNKYPCKACGSTFYSMQYVEFHYKLKHLNMTREEIRNERKSRSQNVADNYSEISSTIVQKFHILTSSEGNEILGN